MTDRHGNVYASLADLLPAFLVRRVPSTELVTWNRVRLVGGICLVLPFVFGLVVLDWLLTQWLRLRGHDSETFGSLLNNEERF